ncbi:VOC family protein [Mucilaginibacter ginkgonis]|uniref:Extradiol dioxygenase n=1 Tax=Mucilaginibacter ginkgonis TaxID=2682091 RepID=A0A6I4HZZ7_9SPHI|nr:VOC family protein [Mucilaginibacter ginkgonis]QQL48911.1 extradiol dioxygenase [Mucilaginibacter ginkgonis]
MTKELWLNLPVADVAKARAFFKAIGFDTPDTPGNTANSGVVIVGTKKVAVMLFENQAFKNVTQNGLVDTATASEIMISFDVNSREAVGEVAQNVTAAGGHVFAPPAEIQGWMYGCAFTDLDGHRWNALYMEPKN